MSTIDLEQIKQVYMQADLLYSESEVELALHKMAVAITDDMLDINPVVFTVMNGGLVTGGKLLTKLVFPLEAGYMHATRYRNTTTGHGLEWKVPPQINFEGRSVLIVDDILDEGHTLAEIYDYCMQAGANEVRIAVLINKLHDRKARPEMKPHYVGIEVEDRYVFGYGMDYQGYWRNAPGIYAINGK
ncbi:hypoxanthine-guanine phosphoribosyltransferase [Pontibacterium sp.]|uniref:hypoxanthine-guanine phosphoribosyltransferase n=1 Tax=Pontibacterium sp. TaxID=2036026 RepID=UPI0035647853